MKRFLWDVQDFLACSGYSTRKSAVESALSRTKTHFRVGVGTGTEKHTCGLMNGAPGFLLAEDGDDVLVRFEGRAADESGCLASYARVLLNCNLQVETEEDPARDGWQLLRVSKA